MARPETVKNTENNIRVNVDNTDQTEDSGVNSPQNLPSQSGSKSSESVKGFSANVLPSEDGGTRIKVVINNDDQPSDLGTGSSDMDENQTRQAVVDRERQRELENRKREYRKKRQASRGMVNLGPVEQESPANVLPDDLDDSQQSKANRLMRLSRGARKKRSDSVAMVQTIPDMSGNMNELANRGVDSDKETAEEENNKDSDQPINVNEGEEEDIEQQLNEEKDGTKTDGEEDTASVDLVTLERGRVNALRKKVDDIKNDISNLKRTLIMLLSVLVVAISKDIFDIIAEILSIGIWSWVDWLLDLPLLIAAFVLKIEKTGDGKAKVIGWAISSAELIAFIDMLPAWTTRVALAIINRNKEIGELTVKKKEAEKKLNKAIKNLIALSNSTDSK